MPTAAFPQLSGFNELRLKFPLMHMDDCEWRSATANTHAPFFNWGFIDARAGVDNPAGIGERASRTTA